MSDVFLTIRPGAFLLGQKVRKKSGSWWEGRVVGYYITRQTPRGYCVQMQTPCGNGPVQIYPESALELVKDMDDSNA